jgi:hypothetical protein
VNRTCKGTRTGGLYRYSCMVVVGNGNGVLGWGQGKAAEVNDSVQKAYQRACRNLYPVPRYNDHTIPETIHSKFGQVRVRRWRRSAQGLMGGVRGGACVLQAPLLMCRSGCLAACAGLAEALSCRLTACPESPACCIPPLHPAPCQSSPSCPCRSR